MKRNAVVEAVFTPDMYKWLRHGIKPSSYDSEANHTAATPIPRPLPVSRSNIVIKATIASETQKAYNFKVMLDPRRYTVKFPFTPSLYIWMPKSQVHKLERDYYEIGGFIGRENLNKALVSLKKKLIDSYEFEAHEILQIREVHLL